MSDFKTVAVEAARAAGKILLELFKKGAEFSMKNKYDILSEADLASEKIIIDKIKESFPEHSIFSEEAGKEMTDSDYLWIIDPVDGTINFSRGMEEFCVSIALSHKGEIILGVIYQPVTDKLYVAERGKGAFLNGDKIAVSPETELINTIAATDNSGKIDARLQAFQTLVTVCKEVRNIRICGSAAINFVRLAEGKMDFYYKPRFNYWDFAAGMIILEEAGGRATDYEGNPCNADSKTIVASNSILHNEVLTLINS